MSLRQHHLRSGGEPRTPRPAMRKSFALGLLMLLLPAAAGAEDITPDQLKFFETNVRPVLAKSCYKCHSQAEGKSKGDLTLDTKAGWMKGGESGAVIVPGKPDDSLLIQAVRYDDPDTQMPPESKGVRLLPQQVADLEAWVKMGAPDPRTQTVAKRDISKIANGLNEEMRESVKTHWAYQPIVAPPVPTVKDTTWPKTPVDDFILAKLEEKGMKPSPPTDKRTLIRRATFDLIGLAPTPKEVLDFVNDSSPDAFDKVVDRLLASPHYGERWGRFWLDVARYADTRGEVKKGNSPLSPFAWTYRDYVIRAFNADRPFDLFIKDQIAADLMPTAKTQPGTLAALGFLTGGDQFQGNRNDIINDQIDVVCKGFLATTVSCARCHDHFFDPIPTRDYYSLHGVFNSSTEPDELPIIGQPGDQKDKATYVADRKALEAKGYAMIDREAGRMATKFNTHAETFLIAMTKVKGGKKSNDPETLAFLKKDGLLPEDLQAAQRSFQVRAKEAQTKAAEEDAMNPMSAAPEKVVAQKNFKRDRRLVAARKADDPVLGLWSQLSRLPDEGFATRSANIISRNTAPENAAGINPLVAEAFRGKQIDSLDAAAAIYARIFHTAQDAYAVEFPVWKKTAAENAIYPGLRDPQLERVRTAVFDSKPFLALPLDEIQNKLGRDLENSLGKIVRDIAGMDLADPGTMARANVLVDGKVKNSPVFIRGEAKSPGPVVPRQFLEFLQPDRKPFPADSSGRLQLAEAIASEKNPLTSRVLVNRVWLHHFGEGFVSTPDDLGVMSEAPSHPELCNWLASEFMKDGWSLKKLHKLIMTSAVYQQSSAPNDANAKLDPFNRLLWRANVRRLDFEALRDSFLAIGGKIDLTMYGHPMNIETEPFSPRRTIYGFVDRLNMAEFMKNFDMANAQLTTGRRHETIVPQQALFRMNSLLVIEQARNVVERPDFKQAADDVARIKLLYEIIYQRWPKPEEIKLGEEFIHAKEAGGAPPAPVSAASADAGTQKARIEQFLQRDPKTLDPKQLARQEALKKRLADQAMKTKQGGKLNELVSDPNAERVSRDALTNWEEFAQALLMTSEAAYLN
jgi:mono/diheme cytochrome c family protein